MVVLLLLMLTLRGTTLSRVFGKTHPSTHTHAPSDPAPLTWSDTLIYAIILCEKASSYDMMYICVSNKVNLVLDTRKERLGLLLMNSNYVHQSALCLRRRIQLAQTFNFYRQQTKLWEGRVFTPVCQSFRSWEGVSLYDVTSCLADWSHVPSRGLCPGGSPWQGLPLDRDPHLETPWTETPLDWDPPGQRPPWTETPTW